MAKQKKEKNVEKVEKEMEAEQMETESLIEEDVAKKEPTEMESSEAWQEKYERLFAEFQNYRNRTEKEKMQMVDYGFKKALENILPMVDNLERALEMATNEEDPLFKGIQMVYDNILDDFEEMDIKQIDALGKPFDANLHYAVSTEEKDKVDSNIVITELQKGYTYKGNVLRYSMVIVSE